MPRHNTDGFVGIGVLDAASQQSHLPPGGEYTAQAGPAGRIQDTDPVCREAADLAIRLRRREPQALGDLYDKYGRLVFSVVISIVHDSSVAEEIVQDAFLRAWNRAADPGPEDGKAGRWLLAIARNRAIDHFRSAAFRIGKGAFELDVREHPALSSDMEREVLLSDASRSLHGAVSRLGVSQRQVITLAYFEGLSQTEIAERMGEPLGTVKSWARGALRLLRESTELRREGRG